MKKLLIFSLMYFFVFPAMAQLHPGLLLQQGHQPAQNFSKNTREELCAAIGECAAESIFTQMEMGKYRGYEDGAGGYQSANPHQGFHLAFTAKGTTRLKAYEQEAMPFEISLQLKGIGYDKLLTFDQPLAVQNQALATEGGSKTTYNWSNNLTEWWINDKDRLEQWFYIKERPATHSKDSQLRVQMAVQTDMEVQCTNSRLRFQKNNQVVQYDKLKVWDVKGQLLESSMRMVGDDVELVIADADAVYPLTIDPSFTQEAYIKASNPDASDFFGTSVAISGNTIVVGAFREAGNDTGVNGNQSNNSAADAGAAYVFVRSGTIWNQQAYLKASNTDAGDYFGVSVAISDNTIVVGASREESNATGIGGTQTNNSLNRAGAAYVFVRSGTTWTQQAYLKASNTEASDQFGSYCVIDGETIAVSANGEDSNAIGINGTQSNNNALSSGAVYVFVRSGTTWSQQAYIKASNTDATDFFGVHMAISGETLVVNANGEDSNATGINGNQADNSASFAGAVYVFVRSGIVWSQQAYLKASNTDAGDTFGVGVGLSGETLVAGALREDSNVTGINGNQSNNSAADAGAAYIFVRSGTTWTQQAYIKASNTDAGDNFGRTVAISGDRILVGATFEASNATGIDGNETDNSAASAGAVYVFERSGTTWSQANYLKASNTDAGDFFGNTIDVSGDLLVIGANSESSNATGIDGDETDNSAAGAGAVYVITKPSGADLNVTVDQSAQTAAVGEFITYVFTVTNESTLDAPEVKARLLIPSNAEFVAATPSQGTYDANTKIWDLGTVTTGAQTMTVTVKTKL